MGYQILGVLGGMGAAGGVVLYFTGRHVLHTMFGEDMLQVGATRGLLITTGGIVLALLATAFVCIQVAKVLQIHKM